MSTDNDEYDRTGIKDIKNAPERTVKSLQKLEEMGGILIAFYVYICE